MRLLRALGAAVVAAGIAVGCSDTTGGGDDVVISDLAGHWESVEATFINQADPAETFDATIVGFEIIMDVTANGRFTGTMRETAVSPVENVAGQIAIEGSSITLTLDDDPNNPWRGSFDLLGDELTIVATVGIEFNFGGGDVPATLRLVMER